MDLFTAIESRRTVRRFAKVPIGEAILLEIMNLASYAPSAANAKPWKFLVLSSPSMLKEAAAINPNGEMAARAPCGIVILGDTLEEKQQGFWAQDCAACTNTMLLAAHGKGLGAVWTGIYPIKQRVEKFMDLLGTPRTIIPFSLVLLGYSEQKLTYVPPRNPHNEIFYNYFGNTELPD